MVLISSNHPFELFVEIYVQEARLFLYGFPDIPFMPEVILRTRQERPCIFTPVTGMNNPVTENVYESIRINHKLRILGKGIIISISAHARSAVSPIKILLAKCGHMAVKH